MSDYKEVANDDEQQLDHRINQLHNYLDDVMREKLSSAEKGLAEIAAEIVDIEDLCRYLRRFIKEGRRDLHVLTDAGNESFLNVYIPDLTRLSVAMCHSFYAELSMEEALNFFQEKGKILQERYETKMEEVAIAKTEIQIFLRALQTVVGEDL